MAKNNLGGVPLRVGIYVRVSSDEQRDGFSIESQKLSSKEGVEREYGNSIHYTIYADEGFSAYRANSRKRPAFNDIMADAQNRKLDVIVVDRLDRWGRESAHALGSLKELPDLGVKFISVREPYLDITTSAGRFQAGIGALSAEYVSDTISDNVLGAFDTKTAKGLA